MLWITPAYAGKRLRFHGFCTWGRDHPRLCGEKALSISMPSWSQGSPPPMRGKVLYITSASNHGEDHPRLCGEKSMLEFKSPKMSGSPPPMRGKVVSAIELHIAFGITPAYAGKSRNYIFHRNGKRDHPRLCGEKSLRRLMHRKCQGSPPPMRGKVHLCKREFPNAGITPAYAGKRRRQ